MEEIQAIADAPANDRRVSVARRIAARRLAEACQSGRAGVESFEILMDRLEGKSAQAIHLLAHRPEDDSAVQIPEGVLAKIEAAGFPRLPAVSGA